MMTPRAVTTLVLGDTAAARERAIAEQLSSSATRSTAIILEGLPDGSPVLQPSETLLINRIAPGCLCCTGNLVLRVTLNRLLRQHPARLFIGVAQAEHLAQLRSWLQSPPYDQLLDLAPDLHS
jgi:hypothetical protein